MIVGAVTLDSMITPYTCACKGLSDCSVCMFVCSFDKSEHFGKTRLVYALYLLRMSQIRKFVPPYTFVLFFCVCVSPTSTLFVHRLAVKYH